MIIVDGAAEAPRGLTIAPPPRTGERADATDALPSPDDLDLLNAISLAERNAGIYLKAWAEVTPDIGLRGTLDLVAARETTHGEVFRQRIERLGYALREAEDPELAQRVRLYGDASVSVLEKVRGTCRRNPDAKVEAFLASSRASWPRACVKSGTAAGPKGEFGRSGRGGLTAAPAGT